MLAILELAAFPLLGASTVMSTPRILQLQAALFGGLCGSTILVLRVRRAVCLAPRLLCSRGQSAPLPSAQIIEELWSASGGVFNVDEVLSRMVRGLENELVQRSEAIISTGPSTETTAASVYGTPPLIRSSLLEDDGESLDSNGWGLPWFGNERSREAWEEQRKMVAEMSSEMSQNYAAVQQQLTELRELMPPAARPRRRVAAAKYIAKRPLKSAVVVASVVAIVAKGAPLLVPLFVRLSSR